MTSKPTKAEVAAWESSLARHRAAKAEHDSMEMPRDAANLDAVLDKLYDEEEVLLRMRAPDIQAVLDKLLIMWEEDLPCGCEESKQQRVVIRDLSRLVKLHSSK